MLDTDLMDATGVNLIYEANLVYLVAAQNVIKDNFEVGVVKTGLNRKAAKMLSELNMTNLMRLARRTHFICSMNSEDMISVNDKTQAIRDELSEVFISISSNLSTRRNEGVQNEH